VNQLNNHIESLIFVSDRAIGRKEIKSALEQALEVNVKEEDLEQSLEDLKAKFAGDSHSFELVEISGGFQFMTKGAYHNTIGQFLKQTNRKRLSKAALETLALIAYKQPVIKSEMEKIRGVGCDYSIQKLLEKELIEIKGRSDGPGRPLLYVTSDKFMDYFGLKSTKDLPQLKELIKLDDQIGEPAPIEEEKQNLIQSVSNAEEE